MIEQRDGEVKSAGIGESKFVSITLSSAMFGAFGSIIVASCLAPLASFGLRLLTFRSWVDEATALLPWVAVCTFVPGALLGFIGAIWLLSASAGAAGRAALLWRGAAIGAVFGVAIGTLGAMAGGPARGIVIAELAIGTGVICGGSYAALFAGLFLNAAPRSGERGAGDSQSG